MENKLLNELIERIEEWQAKGEEIAAICKQLNSQPQEAPKAPEKPKKDFSFAEWLVENRVKNATSVEAVTGIILKMEKAKAKFPHEVLKCNGAYTSAENEKRLQIYHWNKDKIDFAASESNRIRGFEIFTTLGQAAIGKFIFDLLELGWEKRTISAFVKSLYHGTNAGMNRIKEQLRRQFIHGDQSPKYDYEALVLMFNCFVGNATINQRFNFIRLPKPELPTPQKTLF